MCKVYYIHDFPYEQRDKVIERNEKSECLAQLTKALTSQPSSFVHDVNVHVCLWAILITKPNTNIYIYESRDGYPILHSLSVSIPRQIFSAQQYIENVNVCVCMLFFSNRRTFFFLSTIRMSLPSPIPYIQKIFVYNGKSGKCMYF